MKFYIADCHFGDEKVIEFSNRPFENVEEMDECLIRNWNKKVNEWDDIYILGDLIHRCEEPERYLKRLKGRLHLICGNHDNDLKESKYGKYFIQVSDYAVVKDDNHRLVLFHYPLLEWDGYYYGSWHIFGHIHNHISLTQHRVSKLPKALNCGVDVTGFQPVTFDELVHINKKDCDRMKRPQGAV